MQELTARLKHLRTEMREFQSCRHVEGCQVHPRLREEIARLYDEHGGIEIISKITKVPYKTIKEWRNRLKRNPLFFQEMPLHPPYYRPGGSSQGEGKSLHEEQKAILGKLRACTLYNDATTIDQMRSLLPSDVLTQVDALKKAVDEAVERGAELSSQLKLQIASLVLRAGHPRPIALLLGLNQKVILSWKGLLVLAGKQISSMDS